MASNSILEDEEFIQKTAHDAKFVFGLISKLIKGEEITEDIDKLNCGYFIAKLVEHGAINVDFTPGYVPGKVPMFFTLMMSEKFQMEILKVCDDNDFLYEMLLKAIEKNYHVLAKNILDKGVIFDDRNNYLKLMLCAGNGPISEFLIDYRQPEKENFFQHLQINTLHNCYISIFSFDTQHIEDEKFIVEPKKIIKKKFCDFDRNTICVLFGILDGYDSTIVNFCEHREKSDVLNEMINYKNKKYREIKDSFDKCSY